jgi:hypothetical protein
MSNAIRLDDEQEWLSEFCRDVEMTVCYVWRWIEDARHFVICLPRLIEIYLVQVSLQD